MPRVTKDVTASREQVRGARNWIGWTAKDLAERSGVNVATISRFENGSGPTQIETVLKLQNALERVGFVFPDRNSLSFKPVITLDPFQSESSDQAD